MNLTLDKPAQRVADETASAARTLLLAVGVAAAIGAGLLVSHQIKMSAAPGGTSTVAPATFPPVDLTALRQAAEHGDAGAQDRLGQVYAEGRGVKIDYSEAARWYRKAADQGEPSGLNHLGELFEAGQGVPLNQAEAVKYYRAAATLDDPGGQYNLAVVYAFGRGVEKNDSEAAGWYLKAARQGEALAQFNIGQRYELGRGVPIDPLEAYKWLALAADQGIAESAALLERIGAKLNSQQIQEARRRVTAFKPDTRRPSSAGSR